MATRIRSFLLLAVTKWIKPRLQVTVYFAKTDKLILQQSGT